ncbi:unnamed protein product [Symbiodinium necroappetens]|uniref:Uncharacterized protein n=1 Tax=Symbiodinium necroappetens TaxID=1628268 RepID=A0A812T831_9DINO|nr:unnamed protein product [Symbiodinium necroappetens]
MGCSSSVSVMHDEAEDTRVTRVIYTDRTGQEFVQHSAPFKEGVRRFNSMRISDEDASGIVVPLASTHNKHVKQQLACSLCNIGDLFQSEAQGQGVGSVAPKFAQSDRLNKFLAAIEQNPRLLEKSMLPSQLPKNRNKAVLKVDQEVSEQSLADLCIEEARVFMLLAAASDAETRAMVQVIGVAWKQHIAPLFRTVVAEWEHLPLDLCALADRAVRRCCYT